MSFRVTVDKSALISSIDGKIRELGPAKNFILRDAGAFFVKQARSHVHIITGKTQKSTKVVSVSGNIVTMESAWGAPHEEARGDPHDFMSQAREDLIQEFPRIIQSRYAHIMGGGIFR